MTKKDYEAAARITQQITRDHGATMGVCVGDAFVALFKPDNGRFNEDRFRRACKPGANVRARTAA